MATANLNCPFCGEVNRAGATFCAHCGKLLEASVQYATTQVGRMMSPGLLPVYFLLKQRYRILEQIGAGGFAAVYKAEDTQFGNRIVAVKEMSQSGMSQKEVKEAADSFERETLMLAGLQHQNLPRIYDHFYDNGHWYLVMDFIEGETLEDRLKKTVGGYLRLEETLQIGIQLCTVLYYLHTRKPPIIFRDLKPSNVMLTPDGHIYLIDFGIARLFKPEKAKDTVALGSLGYAAPEQYGKAQTTIQSDIYSLGALLHQLLSGNDPTANTPTLFDFPALRLPGQPNPVRLETLINRMVDKVASQRPDSMLEVKKELQQIVIEQTTGGIASFSRESRTLSTYPEERATIPVAYGSVTEYSRQRRKPAGITAGKVFGLVILAVIISAVATHFLQSSSHVPLASLPTPTTAPTVAPTPTPSPTPFPTPSPTPSPTPTPAPVVYHFSVNVAQESPGLNTRINLAVGNHVTITAQGWVTYGQDSGSGCDGNPLVNPDGQRQLNGSSCPSKMDSSAVLSSAPIGELLASIGQPGVDSSATWFSVGSSYSTTASTNGDLYLLFNDDPGYYSDNSGNYQVTVTVSTS